MTTETAEKTRQFPTIDAGVRIARKHIGWYSKGLPGSAEFRRLVNQIDDPARVADMIRAFYDPLIERQAA